MYYNHAHHKENHAEPFSTVIVECSSIPFPFIVRCATGMLSSTLATDQLFMASGSFCALSSALEGGRVTAQK
jgi:hypothetical protein